MPVLGVVLLVLYADKETLAAKLLSTKGFVGIGLISYSAYLWHQPLFAFARIKSQNVPPITLMTILVVASLLLAYLSWKYVETPFRNKTHISRRKIFFISASGIFMLATFGFIGHKTNGFFEYITTKHQRDIFETVLPSPRRQDCHTGGKDYLTYSESCEYFSQSTTVAVFGDSHTVELAYALAEELQTEGQGVKHLSFSGCVPIYEINQGLKELTNVSGIEDCASWTEQTINGLIADNRINTVIISFRIAYSLYGEHVNTYPHLTDERGDENRRRIWNSLVALIQKLEEAGKKTIFVQQAPELPRLIGFLIPTNDDTFAEGVSRRWWRERVSFVYENIDELKTITDVVDLADVFCEEKTCFSVIDNEALYFDTDHMSIAGARRAAQAIIPLIRRYE